MSLKQSLTIIIQTAAELLQKHRQGVQEIYSRRIHYSSQLKKLVSEAPADKKFKPTVGSVHRAQEAWRQAKISGDTTGLNKKTVRILCGVNDVVKDPQFLNLLEATSAVTTTRMIRSLVPTFHALWKQHAEHTRLQAISSELLKSYTGTNKALTTWKNSIPSLINDGADYRLGRELCQTLEPLKIIQEKYCIESGASNFFQEVKNFAAGNLVSEISNRADFASHQWQYLMTELLLPRQVSTDRIHVFIGQLVKAIHKNSTQPEWKNVKEEFKDYLLTKSGLKDPRMYRSNWVGVDSEATDLVISWLSEEDLEFFFQLIIRDDKHKRKPFWLQYLRSIRASRVVVGPDDQSRHGLELSKLREKGRSYSTFPTAETSAFILDFGLYVVVEFSTVGACYVYDSSTFLKLHKTLYKDSFWISALKDRNRCVHRQVHHSSGKWREELRTELARLGIRPSR